jgi:flagellar biosynthesis/type III secretory pathway protein FliH
MATTDDPRSAAEVDARVVRPAARELEPLYPLTRVIGNDAQRAEALLARACAELEDARVKAHAIVAEAEAEAARLRASAEQAVGKSVAQARRRLRSVEARRLRTVLAAFDLELTRLRGNFADDVQRTSLRFARAILDVEFQVRPQSIVALVARALERARDHRRILVHVHPDDIALVKAASGALQKELGIEGTLSVQPDKRLAPHGVRLETEMGHYDASIDEQFRPLAEHLAALAKEQERCA